MAQRSPGARALHPASATRATRTATTTPPRAIPWLWLAVVVLTAANLRPFLTAIGPLSGPIQQATGLDLQAMAWLTLLPMGLMGVGAWWAPSVLQRFGARPTLVASLLLIALGCVLRLGSGHGSLLIATAGLCGAGVALVQGIFPGIIKSRSPGQVAPMMGLYSAALMGGGALGAQLSPLAVQWGLDWRQAMALWALPVLLAVALVWHAMCSPAATLNTPATTPSNSPAPSDTAWLTRRRRTWLLMACFGLVNGGYASAVAWLAPFYQSHGWDSIHSGGLIAYMAAAQAAAALTLPALAARSGHTDRRPWLWFTLVLQAMGFALLAWWPDAAPRSTAIVLGMGLGGCFALTLVVALDHLSQPRQAGALSALMQGGGFVLAGLAPWVVAQLHQATGGFAAGWLAHLASVAVVSVLVLQLAPQRYAQVMRAPG
jgi:CP family cyanate transporter-like MFS transporter